MTTLVLHQPKGKPTRTYYDHPNKMKALEGTYRFLSS